MTKYVLIDETRMLKERLRQALIEQARSGRLTTYKELADRLKLTPPLTIHRIADALEMLMTEDAEVGQPFLAALCVSRSGTRLPARGFFMAAEALRLFTGNPDGPEAREFHAREIRRLSALYHQE